MRGCYASLPLGQTAWQDVYKRQTLYSAFTRLEKNGFIESLFGNETNGKRRTYYRLTEKGREYYREKCEEWQLTKEVVEHFILK